MVFSEVKGVIKTVFAWIGFYSLIYFVVTIFLRPYLTGEMTLLQKRTLSGFSADELRTFIDCVEINRERKERYASCIEVVINERQ